MPSDSSSGNRARPVSGSKGSPRPQRPDGQADPLEPILERFTDELRRGRSPRSTCTAPATPTSRANCGSSSRHRLDGAVEAVARKSPRPQQRPRPGTASGTGGVRPDPRSWPRRDGDRLREPWAADRTEGRREGPAQKSFIEADWRERFQREPDRRPAAARQPSSRSTATARNGATATTSCRSSTGSACRR